MEGPTSSATMVDQGPGRAAPAGRPAPGIPARTSAAVARALAKEPDDRFPTARPWPARPWPRSPGPSPAARWSRPPRSRPDPRGEPGRVPCPACGGLLPVVPEHAGRRVTCTRCHATAVAQLAAGSLRLRLAPPTRPDRAAGRVETSQITPGH